MGDHVNNVWFPCYVNDLLGSMRWRMMTPAQRGAYWQLICWQMQSDTGCLPEDLTRLSALADLDLSLSENSCLVAAFPVVSDGFRANSRAKKEWDRRNAISKKRSNIGANGAKSRWSNKKSQINGNCHDSDTQSPRNNSNCHPLANGKTMAKAYTSTSTSTATITTTPTTRKKGIEVNTPLTELGFAEFWKEYPKKMQKKDAERAYIKAIKKVDHLILIDALKKHKQIDQWTKDGGQFIPLPSTWLNKERWTDETTVTIARPLSEYRQRGLQEDIKVKIIDCSRPGGATK